MILFLELLAREPETQVITDHCQPSMSRTASGIWYSSIGGHVWSLLEPLEATQRRLHQLHGGHCPGRFSYQVIIISLQH